MTYTTKYTTKNCFSQVSFFINMMKTFLCRSSVRREMRDGENRARHTGKRGKVGPTLQK